MGRQVVLPLVLLSIALLVASGCGDDAVPLEFRTLERTERPPDGLAPYQGQSPNMIVVSRPEDWVLAKGLFFIDGSDVYTVAESKNRFEQVDYGSKFALLVVRGDVETAWTTRIFRVEQGGGTISVYALFEDMLPGKDPRAVGSPFHLVAVSRPQRLAGDVTFKLYARTLGTHPDTQEPLFLTDYELVASQKHRLGGQ